MEDDPEQNKSATSKLLEKIASGDATARELLIAHSMERLRRLTRAMLKERPAVRRWNDTDDVLQNALIRLNRALQVLKPGSSRQFIGLAATQIRRELIDLYRHDFGPRGLGANHASERVSPNTSAKLSPIQSIPDPEMDPALQASIHEAIDLLPLELKEVFEMTYYFGMTQQEIADVLDVSVKTIKRRWRNARLALQQSLE